MTGPTFPPRHLDTRPVPLFVQGLITGSAGTLVPLAVGAFATDLADGVVDHDLTGLLALLATVTLCLAVGAYLPLTRVEALERAARRRPPAPLVAATRPAEHRPSFGYDTDDFHPRPASGQ